MSDWLYSEERLSLRAECLSRLFHKFGWEITPSGLPKYSMESLHNCAHDWVSQGHGSSVGIITYYQNHYQG